MKLTLLILIISFFSLLSQDNKENELPYSNSENNKFTPEQDSAFKQAMRSNLPKELILKQSLEQINFQIEFNRLMRDSPWMIAQRNLASIPKEMFEPNPVEITQRQQMIQDAQYVPFVQTLPRNAFSMSLQDIGKFVGLVEDYSPTISYNLNVISEVEIVIYSMNAKVISVIFKGEQSPGNYSRTWNGRDENGKLVPKGDYIGEVRIGNYKYIRKRIII